MRLEAVRSNEMSRFTETTGYSGATLRIGHLDIGHFLLHHDLNALVRCQSSEEGFSSLVERRQAVPVLQCLLRRMAAAHLPSFTRTDVKSVPVCAIEMHGDGLIPSQDPRALRLGVRATLTSLHRYRTLHWISLH